MTLVLLFGCETFETDLEVKNLNNPNDKILASSSVALESTAGTIFQNWYQASSDYYGPGSAMGTMADVASCSWGNAGMRDLSSEPRVAFNNSVSYGNDVTNTYFNALYSVLADSNTVLLAIENGTEFNDNNLIASIGKFGQALAIGYNALIFDKVWLYDETGVIGDDAVDYKTAMNFAIEKLDDAIAIASTNTFSVPENWFNGNSLDSAGLARLMSSFGARMLVMNARNSSEKAQTNWTKVLNYTSNGINEDFSILHDDVNWDKDIIWTLVYPGWGRMDLRVINLMDPSYPDYWPEDTTILPEATSNDARLALDFEYLDGQNFRPERGTYHYSSYRYSRFDEYISEWTTPTIEFAKSELDMYAAEAKLYGENDIEGAAQIIDAGTRSTRGNLPAVERTEDAVAAAIHYERMVEFPLNSLGLGFFEMRKENLLQKGTLLHFPTPGKALDAIPAEYYTYGGTEGTGGVDYSTGGWR